MADPKKVADTGITGLGEDVITNAYVVPHEDTNISGEQMPDTKTPGVSPAKKPAAASGQKPRTGTAVSAAGVKGRIAAVKGSGSPTSTGRTATGSRPTGAPGSRPRPSGKKRSVRRARLRLTRLDPWSVMRMSLLFSITVGIVLFVVVAVSWTIIRQSGSLTALEGFMESLLGNPEGGSANSIIDVSKILSTERVLGFTALVSVLNIVLMTAMATLLSFLYNLAAIVFGGVEVTLTEDR